MRLTVQDSGIGIDAAFLPHVFDPFRQADATTTRRHGGLGIGLAIVRQLVELHGGSVQVASEGPGRGARFDVRLPLARRPASAPQRDRIPEVLRPDAPPGLHLLDGVDVLVVDDEADTRDLLHEVLAKAGARVTTAPDAAEALRLLQEGRPDVLVSDIGMPGMDGFELVRRVRQLADPRLASVPALALTAFTRQEDQARARAAGFDGFHPKPLELGMLLEAVGELARRGTAPPVAPLNA